MVVTWHGDVLGDQVGVGSHVMLPLLLRVLPVRRHLEEARHPLLRRRHVDVHLHETNTYQPRLQSAEETTYKV